MLYIFTEFLGWIIRSFSNMVMPVMFIRIKCNFNKFTVVRNFTAKIMGIIFVDSHKIILFQILMCENTS